MMHNSCPSAQASRTTIRNSARLTASDSPCPMPHAPRQKPNVSGSRRYPIHRAQKCATYPKPAPQLLETRQAICYTKPRKVHNKHNTSGCSAVRLAHLLWEQGVGGSNPLTPTIFNSLNTKYLRDYLPSNAVRCKPSTFGYDTPKMAKESRCNAKISPKNLLEKNKHPSFICLFLLTFSPR